jgi:hypothetical protein
VEVTVEGEHIDQVEHHQLAWVTMVAVPREADNDFLFIFLKNSSRDGKNY